MLIGPDSLNPLPPSAWRLGINDLADNRTASASNASVEINNHSISDHLQSPHTFLTSHAHSFQTVVGSHMPGTK